MDACLVNCYVNGAAQFCRLSHLGDFRKINTTVLVKQIGEVAISFGKVGSLELVDGS
jgi:hypothetical protein